MNGVAWGCAGRVGTSPRGLWGPLVGLSVGLSVGRPGLEPGTLGLKGRASLCPGVASALTRLYLVPRKAGPEGSSGPLLDETEPRATRMLGRLLGRQGSTPWTPGSRVSGVLYP